MKRMIALTLALLCLGTALFADDAKVMPQMVGRFWFAPTFAFVPGEYDEDGAYKSADDTAKMLNLGFALEFGVIDWVTAAVQWAPGWNVWSDIPNSKANMNGVADLFVGAKIQIVGEKAPVANDMFRAAIAPGVIFPMPGIDTEEESKKASQEDSYTQNIDRHAWGFGARAYFDWIINENFFINLYNETIFYPIAVSGKNSSMEIYDQRLMPQPALNGVSAADLGIEDVELNHGYKLTFELEPVFSMPIADGIALTAGLPINYTYSPAIKYTATGSAPEVVKQGVEDNMPSNDSQLLMVKPNIGFFFTSIPVPVEVSLTYGLPVWGKNAQAGHQVTLKAKAYFALPGANR